MIGEIKNKANTLIAPLQALYSSIQEIPMKCCVGPRCRVFNLINKPMEKST
jgi:hypothetical protein